MNEDMLFATVRLSLERMWREAERLARLTAETGQYAADPESDLSRQAGGRG